MAFTESEYLALAQPELGRLLAALDALGDDVEAELGNDILSIDFADGARFVLNSHRAARQIWMAAGARAWHFDHVPDQGWVSLRNGDELWSTLAGLLEEKLGRSVSLAR